MKNELTQVTTRSTIVKAYNHSNDEVTTITLVGDLNITESKQYLNDNTDGFVFISRESVKDTFNVNTIALIQLKEVL